MDVEPPRLPHQRGPTVRPRLRDLQSMHSRAYSQHARFRGPIYLRETHVSPVSQKIGPPRNPPACGCRYSCYVISPSPAHISRFVLTSELGTRNSCSKHSCPRRRTSAGVSVRAAIMANCIKEVPITPRSPARYAISRCASSMKCLGTKDRLALNTRIKEIMAIPSLQKRKHGSGPTPNSALMLLARRTSKRAKIV